LVWSLSFIVFKVRELYACAVSKSITRSQEYKECFQLLSFQSRDELSNKLLRVKDFIENNVEQSQLDGDVREGIITQLSGYVNKLNHLEWEEEVEEVENDTLCEILDRKQFKEVYTWLPNFLF
jgi:methyl coenzyme M reductase subunit C-like uncharacterized protein (methanogenesis marker protein 7)